MLSSDCGSSLSLRVSFERGLCSYERGTCCSDEAPRRSDFRGTRGRLYPPSSVHRPSPGDHSFAVLSLTDRRPREVAEPDSVAWSSKTPGPAGGDEIDEVTLCGCKPQSCTTRDGMVRRRHDSRVVQVRPTQIRIPREQELSS